MIADIILGGVGLMAVIGVGMIVHQATGPWRWGKRPSASTSITELLDGLAKRIPTKDEVDNIIMPSFGEFMLSGEVGLKGVQQLDVSDARYRRKPTRQR